MARRCLPWLALASLALAAPLWALEPPSTVARWAGACNGCHGPEGRGSGAMPALRGQNADALAAKLQQWQDDPKAAAATGHVMARFAAILEPETLRALADHYGTAP
jgi:cytochrome c553